MRRFSSYCVCLKIEPHFILIIIFGIQTRMSYISSGTKYNFNIHHLSPTLNSALIHTIYKFFREISTPTYTHTHSLAHLRNDFHWKIVCFSISQIQKRIATLYVWFALNPWTPPTKGSRVWVWVGKGISGCDLPVRRARVRMAKSIFVYKFVGNTKRKKSCICALKIFLIFHKYSISGNNKSCWQILF